MLLGTYVSCLLQLFVIIGYNISLSPLEEMSSSASYVDLLIVGAGPAGLAAACWAAQYQMSTRIIDQKGNRTETGHADGIQSRTLEILESFGIVDPILRQGIHDVDMAHWVTNNGTGNIERHKRFEADSGQRSRYGQIMLNQGAVEQVFVDYLVSKNVYVERHKVAESLHLLSDDGDDTQQFPVIVGARGVEKYEKDTIHARYLIACDGAHSWVRNQLDVPADEVSEASTWGVLDIVPITDFPDIRRACSIHSRSHGSIMTVPRENRLVRFYIHLRDEHKAEALKNYNPSPRDMVEMADRIIWPYNLTYSHCDWWSIYPVRLRLHTTSCTNFVLTMELQIGRRLVRHYRPHERVFIVGDAAHTHSPKGGQGMNISIQDSYNLIWKLGAVITNGAEPTILETYETERRPVAKQLMDLDSRLVQAYEEEENDNSSGIYEVREQYAGFMAGVDVTYPHSILVARGGKDSATNLARNLKLGMRLTSFLVVYQCDGVPIHLAQRLASDGSWRLLVFPGDLRQPERVEALVRFADTFSRASHLMNLQRIRTPKSRGPILELLLIQSNPRSTVNLLDLPEVFHPFDDETGWDYWRVFADDKDQAYIGYGIDKGGPGCLVLCRPDQHVAWIGSMEDTSGCDSYFSSTFRLLR
ncbi:unnamed protein product [Penicillium nalgiovense]|uniref:FAD-binding domain-containing protein n=1 Tax=Penicillium nalgiovense TaxID=60175 RepID=A0A9W4II69_PENNA|nr:unnamed protein product [Penicillium nalgiovense]CAG8256372.1 unnamed protein product [Penicillium nalgiovense]CAG8260033.1 unnamed protein product [Penicillium nalgiovense]CAG8260949.1 unnamed protein product [Penicillium nalgiovense]CAG8262119.1 unnamed protein product [Penicillium nalgiovense]